MQLRKPKIEQVGECESRRWLLGTSEASWGSDRAHVQGWSFCLSHRGMRGGWRGEQVRRAEFCFSQPCRTRAGSRDAVLADLHFWESTFLVDLSLKKSLPRRVDKPRANGTQGSRLCSGSYLWSPGTVSPGFIPRDHKLPALPSWSTIAVEVMIAFPQPPPHLLPAPRAPTILVP